MKKILVTGGAGYIGSHTIVDLLDNNYEVIVVDNFSNSSKKSIDAIEKISRKKVKVYEVDIKDQVKLLEVFKNEHIDAVIHFASYKAVGESVENPLKYYENNLSGTINLLKAMKETGVRKLVFSSSATVYGAAKEMPVIEEAEIGATNPYGRSKLIIENMLEDLDVSNDGWNIIVLRYFNPLGAHPSGELGEQPNGIPQNLVPYILQVAVGQLEFVRVFGDDYDTPDGTGIRDYIHVMDLAEGHSRALDKLFNSPEGYEVYNLGSEKGFSVLEMIQNFEKVIGKKIPYKVIDRRPGDIAVSYADASKANKKLKWKAKRDITQMCQDAWKWQSTHPHGFV